MTREVANKLDGLVLEIGDVDGVEETVDSVGEDSLLFAALSTLNRTSRLAFYSKTTVYPHLEGTQY